MSYSPRFRIFIIGAGFSVHAGLPLGEQLFEFVRQSVSRKYGSENKLERDLDWYLKYRERCDHVSCDAPVDYEKFMSYLDLEHYLGLRGSDTWSDEGNESQLLIRNGIQEVIYSRTPRTPTDECIRFCEGLLPQDVVLTFNYDTLIEETLDFLGKPYRLFPSRVKEVGISSSIVDSEAEEDEILLSKLHGSIDWYDKSTFLKDRELASQHEFPWESRHPVFKDGTAVSSSPLIVGPSHEDDPLRYVYRVDDLSQLTETQFWQCSPLILSPSSSKILYANPLKSLWRGLQQAGGMNFGLSVVGYSLPPYDEYARQALYHLMRNYTEFEYDLEMMGLTKGPARILDYSPPGSSDWKIRRNYSFMNWDRTELSTSGLNAKSIDWLMQ
ncbi:SIR2 family protein [Halomonas faecis]|uniref:SIR2 family protein n=1 Tax=Halomonas faecis TaxID=1562110 RepID=UPI0013D2837F|nr:SIR2 family protein [Halomonas faecis]